MENILTIVNFVTYSKDGAYFNLVFEDCMEEKYLKIKFKPHNPDMIFSKDRIDLMSIKMRDLEVVMLHLEEHGLTLITDGFNNI